jgi:hypothetical protein
VPLGVDYDDVMRALKIDGIEKFDTSWDVLGEELGRILVAPIRSQWRHITVERPRSGVSADIARHDAATVVRASLGEQPLAHRPAGCRWW